ncbi:MAG: hypothetical protein ACTSR1_12710 [Candidatus Heimdallarchaeota archaeon]
MEDINNDDVNEVYILGINGTDSTKFVILEFSYNLSTGSFYLSNSLSWSNPDHVIIDITSYIDNDYMRFIIAGIDTSSLETYVQTLSLFMGEIRDFTVTSPTTYTFGSDRFRVYDVNIIRNLDSSIPGIALTGSYIVGGTINSIGCLTTRFVSGAFTPADLLVLIDQNDEIIQTSYDLIGDATSNYTILTSDTLEEVNNGTTGLSKIKASAMLYMPDMHIGTFLGVNAFGYDSLNFYSTQHVNYQVKGNAEIIVKDESNEFRIESLKLNGEIQYRSDLNMCYLNLLLISH